jgi:hypothetical protein
MPTPMPMASECNGSRGGSSFLSISIMILYAAATDNGALYARRSMSAPKMSEIVIMRTRSQIAPSRSSSGYPDPSRYSW